MPAMIPVKYAFQLVPETTDKFLFSVETGDRIAVDVVLSRRQAERLRDLIADAFAEADAVKRRR